MNHQASRADRDFRRDFGACLIAPADFNHHAHLRLVYVYLCEGDLETAHEKMRRALQAFLTHHGIDAATYHATLTRAWLLAVRHFMDTVAAATSAEAFISSDSRLLDKAIMLTHYSRARLFSPEARARFLEPDLEAIPQEV